MGSSDKAVPGPHSSSSIRPFVSGSEALDGDVAIRKIGEATGQGKHFDHFARGINLVDSRLLHLPHHRRVLRCVGFHAHRHLRVQHDAGGNEPMLDLLRLPAPASCPTR